MKKTELLHLAKTSYVDKKVAEAGKVDDVKVNGISVVTDKVANISVPKVTKDSTEVSSINFSYDSTTGELVITTTAK